MSAETEQGRRKMVASRTLLGRVTGFTLIPMFSLFSPFLLLPVISRVADSATWASYTTGQTVGLIGASIALWGWNIAGPPAVSLAADKPAKLDIYRESLWSRALILLFIGPVVCFVAAWIAPDGTALVAVAMAAAMMLGGLSPTWFGVAIGSPRIVALYDAVPRFVAMILALPIVYLYQSVWVYPLVLVLCLVLALVRFSQLSNRGMDVQRLALSRIMRVIRYQTRAAITISSGVLYGSAPVPIATESLRVAQAASFASAFQLYRFAAVPILALGNAFQSWVLGSANVPLPKRQLFALITHAAMGTAGALIFGFLGPFISRLLFGESHPADTNLCWFFGISLFFLSLNTPLTRNLLMPAGSQTIFLLGTILSASVGISVMLVSGRFENGIGIASGFAASEALLFGIVVVPAAVILKRRTPWAIREPD